MLMCGLQSNGAMRRRCTPFPRMQLCTQDCGSRSDGMGECFRRTTENGERDTECAQATFVLPTQTYVQPAGSQHTSCLNIHFVRLGLGLIPRCCVCQV